MKRQDAESQLPYVVGKTDFAGLPGGRHAGKVRDSYVLDDKRLIVASDRISTFDFNTGCVPFKGQILTRMAGFWFEKTRDIVGNHLIDIPDPNITLARNCSPFPVEMVVRRYMTGVTGTSMWNRYESGAREFCGHTLPEGLKKNSRLPEAIVTPSTKESAAGKHDRSVSPEELARLSGIAPEDYRALADISLALFERGTEIARQAGYILVDTKYEFGRDSEGRIILIDEVHTPDSSRYWRADDYAERFEAGQEMEYYDKEFVRLWLAGRGLDKFGQDDARADQIPDTLFVETALRYAQVFEDITGLRPAYEVGDPVPRMEQAVKRIIEEEKT